MSAFHRGGDTTTASSTSSALDGVGDVLRIYNPSTSDIYARVGVGPQIATSSDIVVPAKSVAFVHVEFSDDSIATQGGTAKVMRGSLR